MRQPQNKGERQQWSPCYALAGSAEAVLLQEAPPGAWQSHGTGGAEALHVRKHGRAHRSTVSEETEGRFI